MYNERINPQTLIVVLRKCITLVVLAVAPLALFFVVETVITWIAFITFCKSFTEKENISMLQRCVITVYIGSEEMMQHSVAWLRVINRSFFRLSSVRTPLNNSSRDPPNSSLCTAHSPYCVIYRRRGHRRSLLSVATGCIHCISVQIYCHQTVEIYF